MIFRGKRQWNTGRIKVFSVVSALLVASASVSAPAQGVTRVKSAASTSATSIASGVVHVQDRQYVVSAGLASKINSQDWSGLTQAQLASAGIHPGMAAPDGSLPSVVALSGVQPKSAFGCTANICIYITGSGLLVNEWDTSASNNVPMCTFAAYWVRGSIYATTNSVCGNGDFWGYWAANRTFVDGSQLCNTWAQFAGKPCETIHA